MKLPFVNRNQTAYGFTLIELLVTVAIVAILASIAYPSYQDSVRRSHRTEAAGKVLELAQRMERIRAQTFSYASGDGLSVTEERYTIGAEVENETFIVTATPIAGTDQTNDVCGTFTYNNTGTWTFGNSRTEDQCL